MSKCSASGPGWKCDRPHHAKGYCGAHLHQHQKGKPFAPVSESYALSKRYTYKPGRFDQRSARRP